MEFINQIFESSVVANVFAITAFLVSIFTLIWTRRSNEISQQTLDELTKNNHRNNESAVEQKRYELLKSVSEEFLLLDKQLMLIGTLKADYDVSPNAVKEAIGDNITLFTETLPMVEQYKKDIEHAHLCAANWNADNGLSELLKLQAAQDLAIIHTKSFVECNESLVTGFRDKLFMSKQAYFN